MTAKRQPEIGPIGRYIDLDVEVVLDGAGNRITEARAEEIAREILTDVRKSAGRPSLTGTSEHSPLVSFRVRPEVRELAKAKAEAEGKSVSQIAREALEIYIA